MTTDNKQTMTAHKVTQADRELRNEIIAYVVAGETVSKTENKIDNLIAAHRIAAEQSRDDVMIAICEAEAAKILHTSEGKEAKKCAQVAKRIAEAVRALPHSNRGRNMSNQDIASDETHAGAATQSNPQAVSSQADIANAVQCPDCAEEIARCWCPDDDLLVISFWGKCA